MPEVCPAILAVDGQEYKKQINNVIGFAHRIQIDLTDNQFAKHQTINPKEAWWPAGFKADIHLMYQDPESVLKPILAHKPNLVIIHAESNGDIKSIADDCHDKKIKFGVALLQQTQPETILSYIDSIDHILIFSGDLGSYGGQADLSLLEKVKYLKNRKENLEIGWDGGVNEQNISEIITAGVDVVNVGGYIQNAEDPERAYKRLDRIADETGTT